MITLFIDTCHYNLIVGVYKNKEQLVFYRENNDNHLSERLLPLIKKAIDTSNINISDINNIVVANGPGSFTGVRIGVTVAKTLAYALKCSIHTVSELKIMATGEYKTKYIVPLIDARRGFVYSGIYNQNLESVIEDNYISLDDFIKKVSEISNQNDITYVSYEDFSQVNTVVPAIDILKIINAVDNDNGILCHLVNPNYLKKTEAEEKLKQTC